MLSTFGPCWGASGHKNFGNGWWYQRCAPFPGAPTTVMKTLTLLPRLGPPTNRGNMEMKKDGITPADFFPKCVYITPRLYMLGVTLNAVGLNNPGAERALNEFGWENYPTPFMVSFSPEGVTATERIENTKTFVDAFNTSPVGRSVRKDIGFQLNISCPNTKHNPAELAGEAEGLLSATEELRIPKVVKINALTPMEAALRIARHPACNAISPTNTIPYGQLPGAIDWVGMFGSQDPQHSPLAQRYGGNPNMAGGLSGKPIRPVICDWVAQAKREGMLEHCHINGGGGIMEADDINEFARVGAGSVSLGVIGMLRPWRMVGCIHRAKAMFRY